ncbi:MAG: DUF488 domain-containing protein [Methanocellales archaeon]|nr:DUF488 domain-containing protein [Methanocellales archaeon]
MHTVFTIGYGNRTLEDFISILKKHDIGIVVDVRRFPTSKSPDFKKENLESALSNSGIKYVLMNELGGFRKGGYQEYTKTEEYRNGIKRLLALASQDNVAIMCVERSPKACHRRFISLTLEEMKVNVIHL